MTGVSSYSLPTTPFLKLESETLKLGPARSPISGLLSWDPLLTASPGPTSRRDILFVDAPSVQGFGGGCSFTTVPLAQPGPCQASSSTPDGVPGWVLSLSWDYFLWLQVGLSFPLSFEGTPMVPRPSLI